MEEKPQPVRGTNFRPFIKSGENLIWKVLFGAGAIHGRVEKVEKSIVLP